MKSRGSSDIEAVRSVYNQDATTYDVTRMRTSFLRQLDQAERRIIRNNLPQVNSILEVGAGTGRLTGELLNLSERVVAVDYSPEMLKVLQEKYPDVKKLETYVWNAYELTSLPQYGMFDAIVSLRMLPHLDDISTILGLFRGAVRPGGWIVADFWNRHSFHYWKKRHAHVYNHYVTYGDAYRMLEQADLQVVDIEGAGFKLDWLGQTILKKIAYSLIAICRRPYEN